MDQGKGHKGKEFSSHIVKAGHRVYFVDAKADSRGNRYIAISECKSSSKDGGGRDRQRIHIYEEDFGKLLDALGGAMRSVGYELQIGVQALASPQLGESAKHTSLAELEMPTFDDLLEDGEE